MKVLDRYLIRELVVPVICCAVTLVFLVLIADLFDNIDDLIGNKTPWHLILGYYASLAPYAFSQTIAWAMWLGMLFLLVRFGLHNETIAMKAAGLKMSAIVRPLLFVGFLLGILVFLVNDRIVPKTYRHAIELEENYIQADQDKKETAEENALTNVTFFSGGKQLYYFRKFFPAKKEVHDAIVLWLDRTESNARQKMVAEKGTWNGQTWVFERVMEYQMDSQGRILGEPRNFVSKTYPEVQVSPTELTQASLDSTFLTYKQLKSSVRKLRENGVNVDSEKVEMHHRLAAPWQGLVMMLIVIPLLASTHNRKSIAGKVLLCVILVFAYHVSGAIGLALGKAGKLFPFLSAWSANIIFAIGALFTLDKSNY